MRFPPRKHKSPHGGKENKMIIINAFSANMLKGDGAVVTFEPLSLRAAQHAAIDGESAVGHASTAAIFSTILETQVECCRRAITLTHEDEALLGQYIGPRLLEGVTELPEGAKIRWFRVAVQNISPAKTCLSPLTPEEQQKETYASGAVVRDGHVLTHIHYVDEKYKIWTGGTEPCDLGEEPPTLSQLAAALEIPVDRLAVQPCSHCRKANAAASKGESDGC
jgi:hypothetical protein